MKLLCLVPDFPWPTRVGTHLRSQQVIASLAALGELDLFSLAYPNRPDPCLLPPDITVSRLEVVTSPKPVYSAARRARWLVSRERPLEVIAAESAAVRSRFEAWVDGPYDLVWVIRAHTFELLGRPDLGRTIVDLDDLEDQKIRGRLDAMRRRPSGGGARARLHTRVAALQAGRNASRWERFQSGIARSVDTVVLCSPDDLRKAGFRNGVVVRNGYEAPDVPLGRLAVGHPPVVLFQGSMRYGPNTDGAVWFVSEIAPLIRAQMPDVQVRLVGDPDGVVEKLDHRPEITVVGHVVSMEEELARADVVVAPLRYASGTRLKILEALAHRIPVVSTTVGAEGLDLEAGGDLLVADDAQSFAQACVSALTDPSLRKRLADAGERAFLAHHQWSEARQSVQALVLGTAAPSPSPGPH